MDFAFGRKKADQEYDGKRNKTFEYGKVRYHEILHGVVNGAGGTSLCMRAACCSPWSNMYLKIFSIGRLPD